MRAPIFQLDAFSPRRFEGNPAAVVVLDEPVETDRLQAIAAENNLSETAFLFRTEDRYRLRWFTPRVEVPLCGHATMASAAVVMERLEPSRRSVTFASASGPLTAVRTDQGYVLDFPARPSLATAPPAGLAEALGVQPHAVFVDPFCYLARVETPQQVRDLTPDIALLARLDRPGVIVTAAGDAPFDFTSRYFAPAKGVPEDPVTGSAHCMLAPFWAEQLTKLELRAFQASARGGEILCRVKQGRVELEGQCVFYLEGEIQF
ncbi:MAG: PhzF family phenazine biosynthesis protein [Rhodocyclaceae bacterium]